MEDSEKLHGIRLAMNYVALERESRMEKDRHTFDFSLCYDPDELGKYGIMVINDALGNTSFELHNGVCLGYLLDMVGEPFKFAVHFGVETHPSFVGPDAAFGFRMVRPVFKTGRKFWSRDESGRAVKVKEPQLNWYQPTMGALNFHAELLRRLLFAKAEYFRRLPEMEKKFAMMQKVRRRSMGDRECIEGLKPVDYMGKDGYTLSSLYVRLLNGHEYIMKLLHKELGDDYCQCTWIMYDLKKNEQVGGLPPNLYLVQGDTASGEMKVLMCLPGLRVDRLKEIVGKLK